MSEVYRPSLVSRSSMQKAFAQRLSPQWFRRRNSDIIRGKIIALRAKNVSVCQHRGG